MMQNAAAPGGATDGPVRPAFRHWTREELDAQHSPSRIAKDPWGTLARHEAETAALEADPALTVRRAIAFGPAARQRLDVVRPAGREGVPCLAFLHGGFWQEGSKAGSGFAARAFAAAGWAHVSIGYTLAPEARLGDIVAEVAAALAFLRREGAALGLDPARIVLAGHSAGAHLAAAMLAGQGGAEAAGAEAAGALAGVVLVSGVYDLAPVAASYVNDLARIDAAEIEALSPLLARPLRDVPVHLLLGADEPALFRAQTGALEAAWRPHLSCLTRREVPGRDHFDILDELADPGSPSVRTVLDMLEAR